MPESLTILSGGAAIPAVPGDSILSALNNAAHPIHSICGGRGMCGTCRVAIDEPWLPCLPPPAFAEIRLLRVLKAPLPSHRLACQTILAMNHHGLSFHPDTPPSRILTQETIK